MNKKLEEYSREELIEEIKALKRRKKFGLVWEDKKEDVVERCKNEIPIIFEVEDKKIENAPGEPTNLIIEGDNYEALSVLNYTHHGKIDVIYIDPPYNTGNKDFIYNDSYVDSEDSFRHSKWLSFMDRRLRVARELLSDDGVIFISIDDNEQAQLKLLCNDIFGENNYITSFVWEKTQHFGRQKKNYYSNCEYVLCYGKELISNNGLKELLVEYVKTDFQDAPLYNASNPENVLTFPANSTRFNISDGEYYSSKDEKFKLLDKVIVKNSRNVNDFRLKFKSRWSPKKVIDEYSKGTMYWIKSENFSVRAIYGSDKTFSESPKQIIFTNNKNELVSKNRFGVKVGTNESATAELLSLGINGFSYPKPVSLIMYLISLVNSGVTVLDFFAGSGTTGQAILELNKEDDGNRKFILCTNNENQIAENVTYRRIKTVVTGVRPDGTKYSDGISANVRYFKTGYVEKGKTNDSTRKKLFDKIEDMIRVRENVFEKISENENYIFFKNKEKFVAIIKDPFNLGSTWYELEKADEENLPVKLYVFSYSSYSFEDEIPETDLPYEICAVPNNVMEVYHKTIEKEDK